MFKAEGNNHKNNNPEMSDSTWLTLRLVGIGILFVPTFNELFDYFLPKVVADLFSAIIAITLAVIINDWFFRDCCGKRLLRAFRGLFKERP